MMGYCPVCKKPIHELSEVIDHAVCFGALINPDITVSPPGIHKLSDEVAKLEKIALEHKGCRCGEVRATLIVNYGPEGREIVGVVNDGMNTLEMLMTVLRHYKNL